MSKERQRFTPALSEGRATRAQTGPPARSPAGCGTANRPAGVAGESALLFAVLSRSLHRMMDLCTSVQVVHLPLRPGPNA